MNLPNKLTLSRVVLTAVFLVLLFAHGLVYKLSAVLVFSVAALTDFLDGFIARNNNLVSDFGKFMDPIADKILILAAFLAFVEMKLVPAWMVIIIIFREFMITGLRIVALKKNRVIEATLAGKHKTVSQLMTVFIILVFICLREVGFTWEFWTPDLESYYLGAILFLMSVTVLLTLVSGFSIAARHMRIFHEG